jgi:hypothetical protein
MRNPITRLSKVAFEARDHWAGTSEVVCTHRVIIPAGDISPELADKVQKILNAALTDVRLLIEGCKQEHNGIAV